MYPAGGMSAAVYLVFVVSAVLVVDVFVVEFVVVAMRMVWVKDAAAVVVVLLLLLEAVVEVLIVVRKEAAAAVAVDAVAADDRLHQGIKSGHCGDGVVGLARKNA